MSVLVTGATGLVGYNIVKALLEENRAVKAFVRSPEKAKGILPGHCEIVQGDITDIKSIERAIKGCDIVYHAAGFPEQWMRKPDVFFKVNVEGTKNMIDAALENNVKRFVYTSTIDVFSAGPGEEYDESKIDKIPKGTYYERSKQLADEHVVLAMERGLRAVFIHPSGVYGPGPTDSPGTNDLIAKLMKKQIPMLLPGGLPIVFAEDVGIGHVLAEHKAPVGGRYILSEAYYDLSELAEIILEELNFDKNSLPKIMPLALAKMVSRATEFFAYLTNKPPLIPKGQLHFLQWKAVPQSGKAKRELGWKPVSTREGIRRTIEFLK